VTSTRKFIVTDKAKIRRDRDDGVEYWQLRSRNVMLVSPRPESVEITKKGRFYAECYHDIESGRDGGYSWVVDDGKGTFISYPAEHRALLSARIRRAAERRGRGTFEMIMTIAAISIPLIALIVVFAFWGDLTKSTNDAQRELVAAMGEFADRVGDYACQQRIGAAEPSSQSNPSSNIPLADQIVRGVAS
jgi:hypothetical protein